MAAYLNCEFLARDLDSRLLIASYLLKKKQPVVIGQMWSIGANVSKAPPGPILFSSTNKFQGDGMGVFKQHGYCTIATDEEVLAIEDEIEILRCVDPSAAANCDQFMFQDSRQENLLKRAYSHLQGIVAGNPRVELLRQHRHLYQRQAKRCRESGRYILINTNFSLVNSAWGSLERAIEITEGSLKPDDKRAHEDLHNAVERQRAGLEIIRHLVGDMSAKLPSHRIVVRPHPAEHMDLWKNWPRVETIAGSNAIPWMMGAELVIHTGSTTGFESVLLGAPTLNVGVPRSFFNLDRINCSLSSAKEASAAVLSFILDRQGPIASFQVPDSHLIADGAQNIANAILGLRRGPEIPITNWFRSPRGDPQKRKFSVTVDDFIARVQEICTPISGSVRIEVLDDSLFYLIPTS